MARSHQIHTYSLRYRSSSSDSESSISTSASSTCASSDLAGDRVFGRLGIRSMRRPDPLDSRRPEAVLVVFTGTVVVAVVAAGVADGSGTSLRAGTATDTLRLGVSQSGVKVDSDCQRKGAASEDPGDMDLAVVSSLSSFGCSQPILRRLAPTPGSPGRGLLL